MLSPDTKNRLDLALTSHMAGDEVEALLAGHSGKTYYVDTYRGGDAGNDGLSWRAPFLTMTKALAMAVTGDVVRFRGKITEECVGSHLVFDVTIIGDLSLHHADQPASTYDYGASIWQSPASPAAPLLTIRGRGWKLINVMFDAPTSFAAVKLERNALSGTSEFDPSHASFLGCRFVDGKYGIEDVGGCYNVTVSDCEFKGMTTGAIVNTSTAVANPLNWKIQRCRFPSDVSSFGNAIHIDSPLNSSYIMYSMFGTVTSTGKYIDLTGGNGNIVTKNLLGGLYDTTDYVAGTGDLWYDNVSVVKATTSPDGHTLSVPGA